MMQPRVGQLLDAFMDDQARVWVDLAGHGLTEYVPKADADHRALVAQIQVIHEIHGTNLPEALPEPARSLRAKLYEKLLRP